MSNKSRKSLAIILSAALIMSSFATVPASAANVSENSVSATQSAEKVSTQSISSCTIVCASKASYTGGEVKPSVSVRTSAGVALINGTDYTLKYSNNSAVGTATVTVTGKGNYTGTVTKTFQIVNDIKTVTNLTAKITSKNNTSDTYEFSWTPLAAKVSGYQVVLADQATSKPFVTINTTATSYKFSISPNKSYKVMVRAYINGSGATQYGAYATVDVNGPQTAVSSFNVSYIDTAICTGSAITPKLVVKNSNGDTLVQNVDYTVTYKNNVNVGTATITITGKRFYTGSKTLNFSIIKSVTSVPKFSLLQNYPTLVTGSWEKLSSKNYLYETSLYDKETSKLLVSNSNIKGNSYTYTSLTPGKTYVIKVRAYLKDDNNKATYGPLSRIEFTTPNKEAQTFTIGSISNLEYTGSELKPSVVVKNSNGATLKLNTDYTVSYKNNISAGTATVTVTGKGNYSGSKSANFTITQKSIANTKIEINPTSYTYSGKKCNPIVRVYDGNYTMGPGVDYTYTISNNLNAGLATITITGKGNYKGTKTTEFKIYPKSISSATVQFNPRNCGVQVSFGNSILIKDTDYTYSYTTSGNTVTAKIEGKGNYQETITKEFKKGYTIGDVNIDGLIDKTDADLVLNYSAGLVTLSDMSKKLADTDGDGTITSADSLNIQRYFSNLSCGNVGKRYILPVSSASVTLSAKSFEYTGKEIKPIVTVKYGSETFKEGTDYTVKYTNNVLAGTGTVTITGKNNLSGTKSITFKITQKSIANTKIEINPTSFTYSGKRCNPTVKVYDGTYTMGPGVDYSYTTSNNINAGVATITVTGNGNYTGTKTITFKIYPKSISSATVKFNPINCTVQVNDGSSTLINNTDYTYSYTTSGNTVTATITGKGNYTGTIKKVFKKGYTIGDVNIDGLIDSADSELIQNYIVGLATLSDMSKKLADTDGDGKISSVDAINIQRYLSNLSCDNVGKAYNASIS